MEKGNEPWTMDRLLLHPRQAVEELNRNAQRVNELLEANNRYLQDGRDARVALKAAKAQAQRLSEAAEAIIRARDHHAEYGRYDERDFHPEADQCFDDWASDILEAAVGAAMPEWPLDAPQPEDEDWGAQFDALCNEDKHTVRETAKKFSVTTFHAYLRAKDLGLLKSADPAPAPVRTMLPFVPLDQEPSDA